MSLLETQEGLRGVWEEVQPAAFSIVNADVRRKKEARNLQTLKETKSAKER